MNKIEVLYWYMAERGVYLLPMSLVVIIVIFAITRWFLPRLIKNQEKRVLFYIISSSLISSIITYMSGFSSNAYHITEIPNFTISGVIVLYVLYLPAFIIQSLIKKKKLKNANQNIL